MIGSQAEPMKIDAVIAALVSIRNEHGNIDCRLTDGLPVRILSVVAAKKFTLPESEFVLPAHVMITHRDGMHDTYTQGM
jgi:hypothetical protein